MKTPSTPSKLRTLLGGGTSSSKKGPFQTPTETETVKLKFISNISSYEDNLTQPVALKRFLSQGFVDILK